MADYGSADQVRLILDSEDNSLPDTKISSFLAEATRYIHDEHGQYVWDKFFVATAQKSGAAIRELTLYFEPQEGTLRLYHGGVLMTLSTDYTLSGREVTINSSFILNDGERIDAKYTPSIYDDYANYLAATRIAQTKLLNRSEASENIAIKQMLRDETRRYAKMIEAKPYVGASVDHREDGEW
jgi:hypothetical protein